MLYNNNIGRLRANKGLSVGEKCLIPDNWEIKNECHSLVTAICKTSGLKKKKKKEHITTHTHKTHCKKTKPYNNSQAYKEKKNTHKKREEILVNVRSSIMLHFVPPSWYLPRYFFFFLCYRLDTSEALHRHSLLQACMTCSNFWGHLLQAGKQCPWKCQALNKNSRCTLQGKTLIAKALEKHFPERGPHAGTAKSFLIGVKYLK